MGWKATGTWHGHYTFDPVPDWPGLPARVGFRMQLQQSWLFGSLAGEVWDDPVGGMPGRGTVEGRVSGGGVFFLKRMPVYYMHWDGRLMPFSEYLQRELDLPPDEPVPHPALKYTGAYDPATGELSGAWEFATGTTWVVSRGQPVAFDIPAASGRWSARRSAE